ncbi:hypothetical protein HPB47_024393 [Ixodes persulcatus]|uniref:Uncharacterized protein n=1 Tax=Ixodes persulcatus TaxID=34615 RepID=A0AC60Q4V7_IXOPE|nr:hypothetical protein HPB47_024393 [Ixodes persulcatus]
MRQRAVDAEDSARKPGRVQFRLRLGMIELTHSIFIIPHPHPPDDEEQGLDTDSSGDKTSRQPREGMHTFSCDLCNFHDYNENHVLLHRLCHVGSPPLRCHVCSDEFRQLVSLSRHMRLHLSAKPYQCGVCSARFRVSRNFRAHLRTHTGERPFTCGHCRKSFAQKAGLNLHLMTHTGARAFTCHLCPQAFGAKSALVTHVESHFGVRATVEGTALPGGPNWAEETRAKQRDAAARSSTHLLPSMLSHFRDAAEKKRTPETVTGATVWATSPTWPRQEL